MLPAPFRCDSQGDTSGKARRTPASGIRRAHGVRRRANAVNADREIGPTRLEEEVAHAAPPPSDDQSAGKGGGGIEQSMQLDPPEPDVDVDDVEPQVGNVEEAHAVAPEAEAAPGIEAEKIGNTADNLIVCSFCC